MAVPKSVIASSYRYFGAVAEAGSIRGASRALGIAPSAVSRQIALLEDEMGAKLFERNGRGLKLSAAGELLVHGLVDIDRAHENVLANLDALRGLRSGTVRIATVESISVALLPTLLANFSERHAAIRCEITVTGSDAATELVRLGRADLAFTFNPTTLDGLNVSFETGLTVGAVVSPDHPLANRKSLTMAECLAFTTAWPVRGLSIRTILDCAMAAPAQPPFECNSLRLMASLARAGKCIAFQTTVGIEQDLEQGTLKLIPLSDKSLPVDRMMLLRRANRGGSLAAVAFHDLAVEHLSQWAASLGNRTKISNSSC